MATEEVIREMKIFEQHTKNPEKFLEAQISLVEDFKHLAKTLYDKTKYFENEYTVSIASSRTLSELIIEQFDDEQIWQSLDLQNKGVVGECLKAVSQVSTQKDATLGFETGETQEVEEEHIEGEDVGLQHDREDEMGDEEIGEDKSLSSDDFLLELTDVESSDEEITTKSDKQEKKKVRFSIPKQPPSVVDGGFFKLSEFEEFANRESQPADSDSDADDDLEDISEDEDDGGRADEKPDSGVAARYEDFFDPLETENNESGNDLGPSKDDDVTDDEIDTRDIDENDEGYAPSKRPLDLEDDEDDGEMVQDIFGSSSDRKSSLSSFEQHQKKMRQQIKDFEEENLGEKSWQLRGEIAADGRPENSLLEEHLQFDHMTRQAPAITEETTKSLEDIIIQRIKDKAWDDVERKTKPTEEPFEYRRRVVLDSEKSKLSLAEIYEKEYIRQQQKEEEVKEIPEHTEIKTMMESLFYKLDSLSNFHYTPKMQSAELKVINNLPAISVEEVAPVSMSDAALLAPEEIKPKMNWEMKSASEKTETDRKRERRAKKSAQRKKQKEKESRAKLVQRLNPGLGNKYSKLQAIKMLERSSNADIMQDKKSDRSKLSSSKDFFSRLQDQVATNRTLQTVKAKSKKKKKEQSATKLKL